MVRRKNLRIKKYTPAASSVAGSRLVSSPVALMVKHLALLEKEQNTVRKSGVFYFTLVKDLLCKIRESFEKEATIDRKTTKNKGFQRGIEENEKKQVIMLMAYRA